MAKYIITIDQFQQDARTGNVVIECHTNYILLDDIVEWVREEIDAAAIVTGIEASDVEESASESQDSDE
jgi:hypothetical protein